jgi:ribonuclease HI
MDNASIFTAELYAIHQALLRNIQESILHNFVIYSDSLSSLESIEQLYPTRHPLLNQIQDVNHNLAVDKNIAFVWVPGPCNIQGNETADKAATNLQMPSDLKMNTCVLKSKIKKESLATWQNQWELTTSHMLNIRRTTNKWESIQPQSSSCDHHNENRGHTHLTPHSYYMKHLEPPRCDNCDTTLTVPHILYDSGLFGVARAKYEIDVYSLHPAKRRGEKCKFTVFLERYWSHHPYLI